MTFTFASSYKIHKDSVLLIRYHTLASTTILAITLTTSLASLAAKEDMI